MITKTAREYMEKQAGLFGAIGSLFKPVGWAAGQLGKGIGWGAGKAGSGLAGYARKHPVQAAGGAFSAYSLGSDVLGANKAIAEKTLGSAYLV